MPNSGLPLLSLPFLFQTTLDSIPARIPYLHAEAAKAARWQHRLAADPRPRVGLVWAGGLKHRNDYDRTLRFELLTPLLALDRFSFYSLQKGAAASQAAASNLIDHTAELTDFDETAALIKNLDLVITVDTSVAHLAGAMGKPTWILVQYAADWRWLQHRSDNPWYPTATLFRQPAFGDWPGVLQQVIARLETWEPA